MQVTQMVMQSTTVRHSVTLSEGSVTPAQKIDISKRQQYFKGEIDIDEFS